MKSPWKFITCNVGSPEITFSQTITEDRRKLSVIFDNVSSANSPVEIYLPLESLYLSSKTVCVGIRGFSFYSHGFQALRLKNSRREVVWEKRNPGGANYYIPLRLTAYRSRLAFSLSIESSSTDNQLTIDTIDFCSPKP